jgi:DNA adenine methylase
MSIYTPLRYPGGKGKLAPFIKNIFRHNKLCGGTYIEPYAGGAAVALTLLLENFASHIIINDIDYRVYAFWWSVLNETERLCQMITDVNVDMHTWEQQKNIHKNIDNYSIVEVGFATFFLNRTNHSGILQGGVIGGKQQTGNYKIDARFNKDNLRSRAELISQHKNKISIYNIDALDLIDKISGSISGKSLFYFDPPYFGKGKMLYRNSYKIDDHKDVSRKIKSLNTPWIVTYDDVKDILSLYSENMHTKFDISYSAYNERLRGSEVMFYSDNLTLPSNPYTRKLDAPYWDL